jgi:hemolysin D
MNEKVRPLPRPEPAPRPPWSLVSGRDREFLPAALAILETPPAPKSTALMLTLCAFAAAALAWSFFGRLDVHAVAQGKIEATGRSKVIQPLEPGKVLSLDVENGRHVKAGDLLIAFDPTEAMADERGLSDAFIASRAEGTRRFAGVASVRGGGVSTIPWEETIPLSARSREEAVLAADLGQLSDTLANLDRQIAQRRASAARLGASIDFESKLIGTLQERVAIRETLVQRNAGPRTNLIDAQETLQRAQSQYASDQGQLAETDAAIAELDSEKSKVRSQFIADYESKRAEAERKAEDSAQQLVKARARLGRTRLTAPIDGTVQQLAVTTVGQVVTTGQQLMLLVPSDGDLNVEVYMGNGDIGFVRLGQEATIKVDAFPFTRYGTLHGRVTRIATDAVDDQDARRAQANATSLANAANANPPAGQQTFVFPVTLSLDARALAIDDAVVPLSPGMTVTAEVRTESRRVIDYIFSPLAKIASEAMKEK